METSIIIRIKNEAENLRRLLEILQKQDYQNFEIILVNDNSKDGSELVLKDFFDATRFKVVNLERKFDYAYASNFGATNSSGKYLVYLSAHSFPISTSWLSAGIKHFQNEKVAGVFAYPLANPEANLIERIIFTGYTKLAHSKRKEYREVSMGVLGSTNAIYRKDLWELHNFSERHAHGGEDYEWALHWTAKDYVIIHDPAFRVYHSHNLNPLGLIKQYFRWREMTKPR